MQVLAGRAGKFRGSGFCRKKCVRSPESRGKFKGMKTRPRDAQSGCASKVTTGKCERQRVDSKSEKRRNYNREREEHDPFAAT
jgi:hypothetical protein